MRILTITTLYPNAEEPTHGVFVENRLRKLVETRQLQATVVAPVPWFPFGTRVFGRFGQMARVPATETRHSLQINHPRYAHIPKLGMSAAPFLLYQSLRRHVRRVLKNGEGFDLIDAHYVYPDGVAATWLGAALGKPVIVTARGTDLHLIPQHQIPRLLIRDAFKRCSAVVAVSRALADSARTLAGSDLRIEIMRNGVDLELFREVDRAQVRRQFNLTGPTAISVGHLIPRKGHELVIDAISLLPEVQLLICGEGSMRAELERRARRRRVLDRVHFLGRVKHEDLNRYYSAADVLVLASYREGWPNVLLESMACGTPVVATAVGAVPDFVNHPHAGVVVPERTVPTIAAALRALLEKPPARGQVREYATQFSWEDTTSRLLALFSDVIRSNNETSNRPSR